MQNNELVKAVGETIAIRRRNMKMTQERLATILGIAPDTMSRMERGKFAPKMSRFRDIANALNCSVADLFRDTDENASDRASTIVDILKTLPPKKQEALVELVANTAQLMSK